MGSLAVMWFLSCILTTGSIRITFNNHLEVPVRIAFQNDSLKVTFSKLYQLVLI